MNGEEQENAQMLNEVYYWKQFFLPLHIFVLFKLFTIMQNLITQFQKCLN